MSTANSSSCSGAGTSSSTSSAAEASSLETQSTNSNKQQSKPSPQLASKLREIVKSFIHCQDYKSAAFWAEKILFITNDPVDAYERAKCLFILKEYHRAAHTIVSRNFHLTDIACLYLAAYCNYHEKNNKEALQLLESPLVTTAMNQNTINESGNTFIGRHSIRNQQNNNSATASRKLKLADQSSLVANHEEKTISKWLGSIFLLKGKIYEASDNRQMAELAFKEALLHDIFCYEAFTSLTGHHMLSLEDEKNFIKDLSVSGCFPDDPEMGQFVKLFYELQSKKYNKPSKQVLPPQLQYLETNVDVETALAERHFFDCDYYSAYELCSNILQKDAHHTRCLPIYISSLVEIDRPIQLFDIAHQLVDLYPESAISWYAVGCYYLVVHRVEPARRYLSRATTLDNVFGPAWLAFGHSFAIEKEHDQAMAAYFRAYHLMPGCHSPLLFIAIEYGLADDCKLAEKFLSQAKAVAPEDPYVLHEYGVIHYRNGDYEAALSSFKEAEKILQTLNTVRFEWMNSDKFKLRWEPLLSNMGHTLRQLGKLDEAIDYHNKALSLVRANPSTYSSLGFLYYEKGDWDQALEYLNNALSLRQNDSFPLTLLQKTIPKYNEALKQELDKD